MLEKFVKAGLLDSKETIGWRTAPGELTPNPAPGEVVILTDYLERGFKPPGSKFFWDFLHFLNLHPQDLGPNSISNLCQFQVFCEVYLQREPMIPLFWNFFHLNRQIEFHNGPNHELGGVNIHRRRECGFPTVLLPSHPKGWAESWFYCRDTSPPGENPLSGFRADRLPMDFKFPDKLTEEEESEFIPLFYDLKFLNNNGLIGIDLFYCWIEWNILPLSCRDGLMYDYNGTVDHPQRVSRRQLSESEIVRVIKKLTGESLEECANIGPKAFCRANPVPLVRIQASLCLVYA
ncbi:hypothetical protein ZWY2020_019850 [Hordeum vulgare]|nr:hypothetical protein ZWY2020_019850 [Hordeum vulgare]